MEQEDSACLAADLWEDSEAVLAAGLVAAAGEVTDSLRVFES